MNKLGYSVLIFLEQKGTKMVASRRCKNIGKFKAKMGIERAVKHHVMLVLNSTAGTVQACAEVAGGPHSPRQVSIPLYT